jgi:hypothetical protein
LEFFREITLLTSSKDGEFSGRNPSDTSFGTATFDGSAWTNVTWLLWSTGDLGGVPYFGIHSLTVRIPEPGTLALLGLGLAGFAFTRRRKQ